MDEDDDEELHHLGDVSDSDDSSDGFDQMMLDDVVFKDDRGRAYITATEANSETSEDRENAKKHPAILGRIDRYLRKLLPYSTQRQRCSSILETYSAAPKSQRI